jgi:hypothetical protein
MRQLLVLAVLERLLVSPELLLLTLVEDLPVADIPLLI